MSDAALDALFTAPVLDDGPPDSRRLSEPTAPWTLAGVPAGRLLAVKRGLDVVLALAALVVCVPLLTLVAFAVFLTSPGPVLFRQERVGRNGEPFRIVKFRTMVRDAEKALRADPALYAVYVANDFKLPAGADPRLTKVGAFLRKSSLDELPQFWNVLLGHMSMVGPRPVVPSELARYDEYLDAYQSVRPGLTGVWQVHGRGTVEYPERAAIDARYVAEWSMAGDLKLLALTVPAVLLRRGAH